MASPRELRRRIKSVKNTAQITKAMQMVAASKMRKAQQAALAGGAVCAPALSHPARARRRRTVDFHASVAGNAGGAAGARSCWSPGTRACAGRSTPTSCARPRSLTRSTRRSSSPPDGRRRSSSPQRPQARGGVHLQGFADVRRGAGDCGFARDLFLKGEVDQVVIVDDALRQHADAGAGRRSSSCRSARSRSLRVVGADADETLQADRTETLFEPSPEQVLGYLLRTYLNIYRLLRAA